MDSPYNNDKEPITPAETYDGSPNDLKHLMSSSKATSLFLVFTASIIEFSTAADFCNHSKNCSDHRPAWAISVGVLSTLLSLVRLASFKIMPGLPGPVDLVIGIFLTAFWTFGAAFNTESPNGIFVTTDNGYFSTWIALFASAYFLSLSAATFTERAVNEVRQFNAGLAVCLVASVIEFCVAAENCNKVVGKCEKKVAFAVVIGVAGSVLCFVTVLVLKFVSAHAAIASKIFSILLVACWVVGAAVNTSSSGPFPSALTANGYFSTWIAFFSALAFAASVFLPSDAAASETSNGQGAQGSEHLHQPIGNDGPGY